MTVYEGSEFKVEQRGFLNSVIITGHSRLYSGTPRGNTPEHTGCGSVRRKRQDDSGREASIRRGLLASITPTPTKRQQEEGGGGEEERRLPSLMPPFPQRSQQPGARFSETKQKGGFSCYSLSTVDENRAWQERQTAVLGAIRRESSKPSDTHSERPAKASRHKRNDTKQKQKQRNKNACRKERKDESSQKPDFPHKLSDWEVGTGGGASLG